MAAAKAQAHATVNALGHLTPEHKAAANTAVDAAKTTVEVHTAVDTAQKQDETDRQAAIDAAINKDGVDKTHLTPGQRQHLKDHGKDAQSPDQIKKLADELKALGEAQRQAHATVNALGHLTPEHKKAFNDQVDAADTVEKVHQAETAAKNADGADQSAQELAAAKAQAHATVNALGHLTPEHKAAANTAVDAAKTTVEVHTAVDTAQKQDETDRQAAIDAAINKDGVDKTHLTPGQRQHLKDHGKDAQSPDQIKKLADELKALGEAQRQAHATVNALGHLTPEHKAAANTQVDAADTVEKVQVAVQHAQSQDETDRQAAIDAAINKDGVDKTHLTPGQRQHLKDHGKDAQSPDQIKKLADELKALGEAQRQAHATVNALGHLTPEHKAAANTQVDAADTVEKVQVAVQHAQSQDETDRQAAIDAAINKDGVDKTHLTPGQRQHLKDHGKDAQSPDQIKKLADELKALGEAQRQAHATVNALGHLTPEHKAAANTQVDAADTVEKVQVAVQHAQSQDETDRQAAIDAAINKDGVDKTHLTPGQRQHLKDHGKDAQSPDQIKKLADELKALGEAQRQAHATVNALGHLTPEHKKAFNDQVDAADTVEKVHQAETAAKNADGADQSAQELAAAKAQAHATVNALGHLTPEHKAAANTQVDAADTVEKVQVAVQHAQSQDETDRQAAIDAAINKDGVDKTHLTPGQRQHLKDHGKDAQSPDQIKKLADELKALGEAQRQAHATVNALGHLTPEHKKAFNDQVDAADTVEKVHQAETAAKNADGADQSAQELAAAKAQAHATVNALGHLTPEHKAAANTQVDAADTVEKVQVAVQHAQSQDETDRQAAIDAAINKDGVDKTHLTPGQRQHLKDHGKDAQSPDQIKKLADELKALGEAQRQAHATVNALGHLTPEHKAAANTQVDAADTVEKVQVAVQHAQSQDETDRQAAIDAAINKDGVDKTHLTPGQRQHLKDHGKDAQSPDQIKKLADELKALGEAQRQAHATVNALGHLTPEHKAAANTQVDAADTVEKVQVAVQHAQSQDETDRQAAIDAAINKDGVDKTHLTPGQRQHLKDHGKDAQSPDQIKKLADELKALGEAQRQAHATVNALGHLTPEHKAAANTQVDAADTVEKVQVAVQHAQSQDETDRQAAIDAAINKDGVDKTHLTPGQRQHLKDHGKDAQSPDQIKKLADELKALGEAQRQAHATVNALGHLTPEHKKAFNDQVDAADTVEKVHQAETAAKNADGADQSAQELAAAKAQAHATVNALGHLTPEHKAAANTQVDAADTVEKVQVAVQHAQSQDETDRQAAIDAAINKDGVDKTHLTPGQRQHLKDHGKDAQSPDQIKKLADELKALGEAQRQAHATVNALGHLTPEHKAAANTQVDAADTVEKVQVAVQHAQSQDETDRQAAIDAAINKDGVDKTHLTPGQRQHLKDHGKDAQSPDQIKKLADELKALGEAQRQAHATVNALGHLTPEHKAAANTQVDAADTVEKVQVAVQHAQSQDETDRQAAIDAAINKDGVDKTHLTPGQRQHLKDHGKDAQSPDQIKKLADELKALGEAQRQAHATVNALGHLTPEHKAAANTQVDAADTVEKVQVAVQHAQSQDETDRQAAIDAAINKDGVDKTHLTPGQRQHLKDHGKDAQSPDQIKKLADELKALGEAQRQAHATVNALGHLTPEHKKAFNDQVDAADTVEKVHQAETAAKNADGADQSAQELAAAKAQAHATVNALGHLTPEHKAAANTQVDAADTVEKVQVAVQHAQSQDETDRQAAIDAAINKDGVDKTHLTPGQRQHLKDHGKDAQSPDQIKKLADELKALGEAQRQAHATVNALGHLTPEHKKAFNDQVDAADTVEKVHQAETAAKNADGADQSAQELAAAKAQAHATVNALGHLTPEHKAAANTQVDAADTVEKVQVAVQHAQSQDETDRQAAIDAAINKDGVDKTHLTPGQRQHLKDHGKDAQSPDQIKKLADELKALGEAQRQAHATVNALGHLTPEHKAAANTQVDAADTVEKVQVAVQHAQSQDETDRQAAIDAAINKDGVDKTHLTPGQRQHLKDHGKDAQSPDQIKKLADELKALGEAQRQAHATVNALGHLTPEHKAAANTQVDAADTVEKVQVAVQHAQSQDETDRQAAIDAAINKDGVDKTHLTPGQRQHLKDHGKDAQSPDQIKKLADELKALGEAQRQAHATVNALGHLTPEHKAAANTQVDAADTVEKVQVAVQHAQSQDETDRQAAIDAAINKDGVDKTHLTPGQRQHLKDHGKDAQSPDQIKKLADELKALGEAQRQAHATVNALGHLTPEHKKAFNDQVDAADTVEKVHQAETAAKNADGADQSAQELAAAKAQAHATVNALGHLTPEHKAAANTAVDAAKTTVEVHTAVDTAQKQDETDRQAAIDAAINKDGVDKTHLTPGQRQHLKDHGKDAQSPDQIKKLADELKALGEAQRQAHATVNALGHLTPEHKAAANTQVDAADTVEKVHQAETAAKNADGADHKAAVGNIAQGSGQAGGPDTSAQAGARHAGQGGRHLAQTGRELADLAGVSAALLVAGVAVVAIVRRRKKHL
ncbi:hypothetical protein [Rothia koreensis]|uniref:hypothetical protein n=1 Tax=Rothia koreensis TaxID=592378 RepID=UPI003FCD8F91